MTKILLHVSMIGDNVLPETVRASDLAKFLTDVEKAIQGTALAHGRPLPDDALVSLIQIAPGDSSDMVLAIDSLIGDAPAEVTGAIAQKRFGDLPQPTRE